MRVAPVILALRIILHVLLEALLRRAQKQPGDRIGHIDLQISFWNRSIVKLIQIALVTLAQHAEGQVTLEASLRRAKRKPGDRIGHLSLQKNISIHNVTSSK